MTFSVGLNLGLGFIFLVCLGTIVLMLKLRPFTYQDMFRLGVVMHGCLYTLLALFLRNILYQGKPSELVSLGGIALIAHIAVTMLAVTLLRRFETGTINGHTKRILQHLGNTADRVLTWKR